jgi:glutaredoxin
MSATRPQLTLYERAGCHLCEEVGELLDAQVGPDRYRRVDVDADADLVLRYGFRVPVVSIDGQDCLEAPMTESELLAVLASSGASRSAGVDS